MPQRNDQYRDGDIDGQGYRPAARPAVSALPIAIAIIVAGALIAAGIVAAVLMRGGGGGTPSQVGQASQSASASGDASASSPASAAPTSSGAAAASPVASPPPDPLGLHLNLPVSIEECGHLTVPNGDQVRKLGERMRLIFQAAEASKGQNHGCTIADGPARGMYVSYHKFDSTASMEEAFSEGFASFFGLSTSPCEETITGGFGDYQFDDGRTGTALCSRQPNELIFLVWTEETTNVISTIYGTNTSEESADALRTHWMGLDAGPVCRTELNGPRVPLEQCRPNP